MRCYRCEGEVFWPGTTVCTVCVPDYHARIQRAVEARLAREAHWEAEAQAARRRLEAEAKERQRLRKRTHDVRVPGRWVEVGEGQPLPMEGWWYVVGVEPPRHYPGYPPLLRQQGIGVEASREAAEKVAEWARGKGWTQVEARPVWPGREAATAESDALLATEGRP